MFEKRCSWELDMLPKIPTNLGKSDTSSERGEHFKHRVM